jgi:hypothetical protein
MSDTFGKWAKSKGILTLVGGAAAVTSPSWIERGLSLWDAAAKSLPRSVVENLPTLANLVVLLLIVLLTTAVKPIVDEAKYPKSSRLVLHFRNLWIIFWLAFLVLYFYRSVVGIAYPPVDVMKDFDAYLWRNLVDNFLGNVAVLFLFLCYAVLAGYSLSTYVVGAALVLIVVSVLEGVGIHLTAAVAPKLRMLSLSLWQMLLATLACTIFALLIGRLESKVIKPPLWIIFALYFYGALQPVSEALGATKQLALLESSSLSAAAAAMQEHYRTLNWFVVSAAAWLGFFAALLKFLFFLLMLWLMDGVLLFYARWITGEGGPGGPAGGLARERADFVYAARAAAAEKDAKD